MAGSETRFWGLHVVLCRLQLGMFCLLDFLLQKNTEVVAKKRRHNVGICLDHFSDVFVLYIGKVCLLFWGPISFPFFKLFSYAYCIYMCIQYILSEIIKYCNANIDILYIICTVLVRKIRIFQQGRI